jgi:hypothetical protein
MAETDFARSTAPCPYPTRKPYGTAFRHKKRALPNSRKRCMAREREARQRLVRSRGSKKSGDQEKRANVKPRIFAARSGVRVCAWQRTAETAG